MKPCYLPSNLGGRVCSDEYMREAVGVLITPISAEFATLEAMESSAVIAKINEANPINRFLPIENIENYEPEQQDAQVHEFNSGNKSYISDGAYIFRGVIRNGDPLTAKAINRLNNLRLRAIPIGTNGFQYKTDSVTKTKIKGFRITPGSFVAKFVPSTGQITEHVLFEFSFEKSTNWDLWRFADYGRLGYNLSEIAKPLIPVDSITVTNPATTGFNAFVLDNRGNPITGLETFTVFNETTSEEVTAVVTEDLDTPGGYSLATATGVLPENVLKVKVAENGFDSYGVTGTVTIPA